MMMMDKNEIVWWKNMRLSVYCVLLFYIWSEHWKQIKIFHLGVILLLADPPIMHHDDNFSRVREKNKNQRDFVALEFMYIDNMKDFIRH